MTLLNVSTKWYKMSFESALAIDTWGIKYSCDLCDFKATFKHALKIPSLRVHKQMKHLWNYELTCFKDLSVKESCPIQPLCFQKMFPFQKYLWWIKWSKYHILSYFCISRIFCISCTLCILCISCILCIFIRFGRSFTCIFCCWYLHTRPIKHGRSH